MGHMFGFVIVIIALGIGLVASVLLGLVKLLRGPVQQSQSDEETRIMQEMYTTMSKLEHRVESLETILMEREGKE